MLGLLKWCCIAIVGGILTTAATAQQLPSIDQAQAFLATPITKQGPETRADFAATRSLILNYRSIIAATPEYAELIERAERLKKLLYDFVRTDEKSIGDVRDQLEQLLDDVRNEVLPHQRLAKPIAEKLALRLQLHLTGGDRAIAAQAAQLLASQVDFEPEMPTLFPSCIVSSDEIPEIGKVLAPIFRKAVGRSPELFRPLLASKDERTVFAVALALTEAMDEPSLKARLALLEGPFLGVGLRVLATDPRPKFQPLLLSALKRSADFEGDVSEEMQIALVCFGSPSVKMITDHWAALPEQTRIIALSALKHLPTAECQQFLIKQLKEPNAALRFEVLFTLGMLDPDRWVEWASGPPPAAIKIQDAVPAIRRMLQDPDERIRELAAEIIDGCDSIDA